MARLVHSHRIELALRKHDRARVRRDLRTAAPHSSPLVRQAERRTAPPGTVSAPCATRRTPTRRPPGRAAAAPCATASAL